MKKAFTLVELMVAVGILAIILSFAGIVFNAGIGTYRTAAANAEIMRKLRAITDRLDADFEGLRKDGEIFVVWKQKDITPDFDDCDLDGFERLDRIMFFATGDFQSYGTPMIRGNLARISYMLATRGGLPAESQQPRSERVLARTQHILTADADAPWTLDPNSFTDTDPMWYDWHNRYEHDKIPPLGGSLEEWKHVPWDQKEDMLTVITDVNVGSSAVSPDFRGAHVDPQDSSTIHMLLCEGVGEFKIQGWSYDSVKSMDWRWIPEVDPNRYDGTLNDSDFFLGTTDVPGVLYPYRAFPGKWGVRIKNLPFPPMAVSEANFNIIPGLGRALKFTFTLFDSKGIIEQGRTFTHIVYLDK